MGVGTNGDLSPHEQPGADEAEDGGDDEPGAALYCSRAAGEGGEEEDDPDRQEDVSDEHRLLPTDE